MSCCKDFAELLAQDGRKYAMERIRSTPNAGALLEWMDPLKFPLLAVLKEAGWPNFFGWGDAASKNGTFG